MFVGAWLRSWRLAFLLILRCFLTHLSTSQTLCRSRLWPAKALRYKSSRCWTISISYLTAQSPSSTSTRFALSARNCRLSFRKMTETFRKMVTVGEQQPLCGSKSQVLWTKSRAQCDQQLGRSHLWCDEWRENGQVLGLRKVTGL